MSTPFDDLSNDELRAEIVAKGFTIGPITPSTRKLYVKKLMNLTSAGDAVLNAPRNRSPLVQTESSSNAQTRKELFEDVGDHEETPDSDVVETDANEGHGIYPNVEEFGNESEDDYMESSRYLSHDESMQFLKQAGSQSSPLAQRRRGLKAHRSRLQYVVAVLFAVLVVYAVCYFFGQNFYIDKKNMPAIKSADSEL